MSSGGVYAYRTRKPGARFCIPFLSRHWGYVGQTSSFWHRDRQHLWGDVRYGHVAKPWADLDPKCYRLPLPNWKWLRLAVEAVAILLLAPVYNDKGNRWNPRRIPLSVAARQRAQRNRGLILWTVRPVHVVLILVVFAVAWYLIGGKV